MLFRDLGRAFGGLFVERRSRVAVVALLLAMAAVPVAELGVMRTFSQLVIKGPREFHTDRGAVLTTAGLFFGGFAVMRALHHLVRFWRVRVFRKGFETSGLGRTHGQASWEWAQGFELSNVSVGLIQVLCFSALFLWVDPLVGAINAGLCAVALTLVSALYVRQLAAQEKFADEGMRAGSTPVHGRIRTRVFAAEFGSMIATVSMAVMMLVVVWRALAGDLASTDGVVLFLGLRLLYGHLGALCPSVMRFARDSVRRHASRPDPAASRRGTGGVRRADLATHAVIVGQRGEIARVRELAAQLEAAEPTAKERDAIRAAEAFAAYANSGSAEPPLALSWWPRPFPGNLGDWLSPFVLGRASGHRVQFRSPTAPFDEPHLVMIGSIGRFVRGDSIVVGTGIARPETHVHAEAQFISVRGPLTARAVERSGGPVVDSFGEPALLLSRLLPIERTAANGRLLLVRHPTHADVPVTRPDGMDERTVLAAHPDAIVGFLETLCRYDGVVTSSMHVMIACHSYGVPCTLVTFPLGSADRPPNLKYRDYSLGAALDEVWEPQPVDADLSAVDWPRRLRVAAVPTWKIDEIDASVARAVKEYQAAAAQFADAAEDADLDDDGDV